MWQEADVHAALQEVGSRNAFNRLGESPSAARDEGGGPPHGGGDRRHLAQPPEVAQLDEGGQGARHHPHGL